MAWQRFRSAWRAEAALLARQAHGAKEAVMRSVSARGAVDTECAIITLALAARAGSALGVPHIALVTEPAGGAFAAINRIRCFLQIDFNVFIALVTDIEMVISA